MFIFSFDVNVVSHTGSIHRPHEPVGHMFDITSTIVLNKYTIFFETRKILIT